MNFSRRQVGAGLLTGSLGLALPSYAFAAETPATLWEKLPTEPYKGKQDDIFFVDPDTGWYGNSAGKLFNTTDGGRNWTKIFEQPGTFIRALGFIDAKTGFLGNVGTDYYPGVTDPHPLYSTDDGGVSWAKVATPGIEMVKGICGIDILHRKAIFQGEMIDRPVIHAAGRVGGTAAVMRSVDGGASWSVQDLSAQAGMILDVKFLTPMTGFLCTTTNADLEQGKAQILRTLDGGKTWAAVYQSSLGLTNSWKMNWPSARVGYASIQNYAPEPAGVRRVIIKTTDGGRNWREMFVVDDIKAQEFGIGFADEKHGWVGCASSGYETCDGGKSWKPVAMGRAVNKIRVVGGPGKRRAFAIGVDVHRLDLDG
jgi:photosystem II stability/assembly factor-like uncharacterized protein